MSEKIAFVTGGTGGLGSAIVTRLLAESYQVLPWSRHPAPRGTEAAGCLWSPALDVQQSLAAWHRHVNADIEAYGTPDMLVVAHGAAPCVKATVDLTEADVETVWQTDIWGTFAACQTVGRAMLARRRGSIVIVSSIHSKVTYTQRLPYSVAKSALSGLVRSLALEWGPHGLTVNAVCPWQCAGVRTERFIAAAAARGEDLRTAYLERSPLRRLIAPEEVADAVLFLVQNRACNGLEVVLDGGVSQSMWYKSFAEHA